MERLWNSFDHLFHPQSASAMSDGVGGGQAEAWAMAGLYTPLQAGFECFDYTPGYARSSMTPTVWYFILRISQSVLSWYDRATL